MSETRMKFKSARQIPSEGTIQGVLAEIYHIGEVETQWGLKDKVKFIFEITETREGTDIPLTVSQDFSNTWSRKSKLYQFVERVLGRQLTVKESGEFDPETLIGKNVFLTIVHKESNGKNYANIASIMPMMKSMPDITVSPDYTPFADVLAKWKEAQAQQTPDEGVVVDAAPSNVQTSEYQI